MAGIFFEGGVSCSLTINAQCNVGLSADCFATYYPPRCNVGVNPLQMNAVISELVNAINVMNVRNEPSPYDCTRLDNLAEVLRNIRNLCNQPTLSANIDISDRIAGCFDDQSGTITVGELLDWLNTQFAVICGLPAPENPLASNTVVAACVRGEEAGLTGTQMTNMAFGGSGYEWKQLDYNTRRPNTQYRNTFKAPIMVSINTGGSQYFSVSPDPNVRIITSSWEGPGNPMQIIVPPDHYFGLWGDNSYRGWSEMLPIDGYYE